MSWKQQWISEVLAEVPASRYRARMEAELRDHLETQCRALMEAGRTEAQARAESLRAMGEPDKLREEYRAAWRRSCPGQLRTWGGGCAVMAGVHLLTSWAIGTVWSMALSLPGDSQDPWIRLIRGTLGDLNNSLFWRHLFPLALALTAGAWYLSRKFRASRRPAFLITAGLSVHWTYITAFSAWWSAIDNHHRPFWEAAVRHLTYNARYYILTLALCVLLGVVFGHISKAGRLPAMRGAA